MTIEEESTRSRREERKSENSSQIPLQMKSVSSQSQRNVDVDDTSQTHLKNEFHG